MLYWCRAAAQCLVLSHTGAHSSTWLLELCCLFESGLLCVRPQMAVRWKCGARSKELWSVGWQGHARVCSLAYRAGCCTRTSPLEAHAGSDQHTGCCRAGYSCQGSAGAAGLLECPVAGSLCCACMEGRGAPRVVLCLWVVQGPEWCGIAGVSSLWPVFRVP